MDTIRSRISLDDGWRIALDPTDVGIQEGWAAVAPTVAEGNLPSGGIEGGVRWYFREFDLDDSPLGKCLLLFAECSPHGVGVWLNGQSLSAKDGIAGAFDAAPASRAGRNALAVRVESGGGCGRVWIEIREAMHLSDVIIQPDIRRKRVVATVAAPAGATVRLRIRDTEHGAEGPPGRLVVSFPEFELWSPDNPKLYLLDCELSGDGAVSDFISIPFGMREFTVKENRFHLNNKPIVVRGLAYRHTRSLLDQSGEDAAPIRQELLAIKTAGFNSIAIEDWSAAPLILDSANETGLLVMGGIQRGSAAEAETWNGIVRRDRNHPSLVIWWLRGTAGIDPKGGKHGLAAMRELDPARLLCLDASDTTGSRETARYIRPYHSEVEPVDDVRAAASVPLDREGEQFLERCGNPGSLAVVSRIAIEDPGLAADGGASGFAERELDRAFGDVGGFVARVLAVRTIALRLQIEAIRANSKLSGFWIGRNFGPPAAPGADGTRANESYVLDAVKAVQKSLLPVIRVSKTNLIPREEVPVTVSLVNDLRSEFQADLSLQVVGPTNQVLWKKKRTIKVQRTMKEIWSGSVSASGAVGTHKFVVRLIQGVKVIAENSRELHVCEPAARCEVDVHVIDPHREWGRTVYGLAPEGTPEAPVHIVPPLANTIRAYPESELLQALEEARGGAVVVVFNPPDDWNDLADQIDPALRATNRDTGERGAAVHYVKLHPMFEGLPSRGLMGQPYANVYPSKTFVELSDEDICGTYDPEFGATPWGSDVLVRRFGTGRVVFAHLRVLEHLGRDVVADRLFTNLVRHFARRSVPSPDRTPIPQSAIDWLKRERDQVRLWMTAGPFPNWDDGGHDAALSPEHGFAGEAEFDGLYGRVRWRRWYSRARDDFRVDFGAMFAPRHSLDVAASHVTGYAYAEFTSPARQASTVVLRVQDAAKIWLNGALVHESRNHLPDGELESHRISAFVKQGRNTVSLKLSKRPGQSQFALSFESATRDPLILKWWR